jgi:hypothetical protein
MKKSSFSPIGRYFASKTPWQLFQIVVKWSNRVSPPFVLAAAIIQVLIGFSLFVQHPQQLLGESPLRKTSAESAIVLTHNPLFTKTFPN